MEIFRFKFRKDNNPNLYYREAIKKIMNEPIWDECIEVINRK